MTKQKPTTLIDTRDYEVHPKVLKGNKKPVGRPPIMIHHGGVEYSIEKFANKYKLSPLTITRRLRAMFPFEKLTQSQGKGQVKITRLFPTVQDCITGKLDWDKFVPGNGRERITKTKAGVDYTTAIENRKGRPGGPSLMVTHKGVKRPLTDLCIEHQISQQNARNWMKQGKSFAEVFCIGEEKPELEVPMIDMTVGGEVFQDVSDLLSRKSKMFQATYDGPLSLEPLTTGGAS